MVSSDVTRLEGIIQDLEPVIAAAQIGDSVSEILSRERILPIEGVDHTADPSTQVAQMLDVLEASTELVERAVKSERIARRTWASLILVKTEDEASRMLIERAIADLEAFLG